MACGQCTKLIVDFFDAEILGHNWASYTTFESPLLTSQSSPSLVAMGVFRSGGCAVQESAHAAAQESVATINAATFGQVSIRRLCTIADNQCTLEAVLPREFLDGVPTVDILRLLVKNAPTLRRCKVNPQLGLELFCVTLEGTLKVDVWTNTSTFSTDNYDQCLGRAINDILALPRP